MKQILTYSGFSSMKKLIEQKCGILIDEEKAYLIESRLSGLLAESGLMSFEEFFEKISFKNDPEMIERMIDAMTTNETMWFRDRTPWLILERFLLPLYIETLRQGVKSKIRIWSAGCSTGQEPYSIAMYINRFLSCNNIKDISISQFEILATDISRSALDIAEMGRYDNISVMRGLTEEYRDLYFTGSNRLWVINDSIRNAVKFRRFNLQNDFALLGDFDLVFCRYTMIYFSDTFKKEVLYKIHKSLIKNGILIIGSSELMLDCNEYYNVEQLESGVIYRRKG